MASHEKLMILPVLGGRVMHGPRKLALVFPKQYCFSSLIVEDSSGEGEDRGMQPARVSKPCGSCDGQSFFFYLPKSSQAPGILRDIQLQHVSKIAQGAFLLGKLLE